MAIELHIFLHDSGVPSREALQDAIDNLGFPTILDTEFDLREDTGFVPATFRGEAAGFEFYLESAEEILATYVDIAARVGSRDKCATFRWGGRLAELGAALSVATALTKIADGIYFYPDDGILYEPDEAVAATQSDLASI